MPQTSIGLSLSKAAAATVPTTTPPVGSGWRSPERWQADLPSGANRIDGLPSQPAYPDQGLPGGSGGRPDQGLPPFPSQGLPPGGENIPNNELPIPEPPADHADDIIVAVHWRRGEEWVVKAYDADADDRIRGCLQRPSRNSNSGAVVNPL